MKKNLIIMSFIMISSLICAQKPIEIKLWPEGTPNDNGLKEQKENGPLYVAEPTLCKLLHNVGYVSNFIM